MGAGVLRNFVWFHISQVKKCIGTFFFQRRPAFSHTSVYYLKRVCPVVPTYVRTTNSSVRPLNLAYVCPKVQITLLVSLVTQSPN
jgi:hypothetical protein